MVQQHSVHKVRADFLYDLRLQVVEGMNTEILHIIYLLKIIMYISLMFGGLTLVRDHLSKVYI